jgi:hypothetical protein
MMPSSGDVLLPATIMLLGRTSLLTMPRPWLILSDCVHQLAHQFVQGLPAIREFHCSHSLKDLPLPSPASGCVTIARVQFPSLHVPTRGHLECRPAVVAC